MRAGARRTASQTPPNQLSARTHARTRTRTHANARTHTRTTPLQAIADALGVPTTQVVLAAATANDHGGADVAIVIVAAVGAGPNDPTPNTLGGTLVTALGGTITLSQVYGAAMLIGHHLHF